MTDLGAAFRSPFGCSLSFDIVPLYTAESEENRRFLGVVTIEIAADQMEGFSYSVYPSTSAPVAPLQTEGGIRWGNVYPSTSAPVGPLQTEEGIRWGPWSGSGFSGDAVIKGNVADTNNTTFTFPVKGLNRHYFVLVTPRPAIVQSPIGSQMLSTPSQEPAFAIFYTAKVLKERKRRIKQRKPRRFHYSGDAGGDDKVPITNDLGDRLKAMEEGRLHDDLKIRTADWGARQPADAKRKNLRYTEGTEFVPAPRLTREGKIALAGDGPDVSLSEDALESQKIM